MFHALPVDPWNSEEQKVNVETIDSETSTQIIPTLNRFHLLNNQEEHVIPTITA